MREPTFLVLSALAGGRKHGYALIGEVDTISGGRVRLRPGSLYATIDRLCEDGLIAPAGEEVVSNRLRRYYELTDAGASALTTEVSRLRSNIDAAAARLRTRTAG